ncbi:MAG: response regulator [Treponema sp.]|nr:response regulator [Treponema sp.]
MNRVLLTGTRQSVIDFFFENMTQDFDFMTSSVRARDLERHIEVYSPHIVLYCISDEDPDEKIKIEKIYRHLPHDKLFFGIAGIKQQTIETADFTIQKPLNVVSVRQIMAPYLNSSEAQAVITTELSVPQDETQKEDSSAKALPDNIQRKHILVIDDDPLVLKVLREHLHEKYDVAVARNGNMAYRFLDDHRTDLILIDYEMPGEKGPSVLTNIRKLRWAQNIPAIFLTGVTDSTAIMEAAKAKPQGYLLKPVDKEKLFSKIQEILGY